MFLLIESQLSNFLCRKLTSTVEIHRQKHFVIAKTAAKTTVQVSLMTPLRTLRIEIYSEE